MVTIKDITQETGLARTTVAEILRGKGGYSEQSRKRVMEVAHRLGYQPNYLSKALCGGPSMSIGAFWPLSGTTGDVDIVMAVLEQARQQGYVVYNTDYRPGLDRAREALREFASRRVDAVIFWWRGGEWAENAFDQELAGFPVVVAVGNESSEHFKGDLIVHDRLGAIEEVVDHLVALGRRRLAIVMKDEPSQRFKIDCFLSRCQQHGLSKDACCLIDLNTHSSTGKEESPQSSQAHDPALLAAYQRVFESRFRGGVDIDGLLCGTDEGAMAAMRYFEDRDVKIPQDVAVIGWNNLPISSLWRPGLASIDRRRDILTQCLSTMLFSRLQEPDLPPRHQVIPMQFVWRASAGGHACLGQSPSQPHV